eukprot:scaffold265196_cov109-Cyclotella_meneghiniana.AAC.2
MLEEPWLKCSSCCEDYNAPTQKLLADEFFRCYKNKGGVDIRACIAVLAFIKADCEILGKNEWSEEPYAKIQLFKQVVESNNANESSLFTRFKLQIENDIASRMRIAEFYLPPKRTPKPPEAACWICLDDEPDEHGNSLERTCACRGTSGYCHLYCVSNFALQKNESYMQGMIHGGDRLVDKVSKELAMPWTQCPTCNQKYTGTFALRLAQTFFMQYDSYPYNECRRQTSIETLSIVCLQTSSFDVGIFALTRHVNLIRTMLKELCTNGKIASGFLLGDSSTQEIKQQLGTDYATYCMHLFTQYKSKGEIKIANNILRELKSRGMEAVGTIGSDQITSIEDMLNGVEISPDEKVERGKAEIKRLTEEFGEDAPEVLSAKFSLWQDLIETKSVTLLESTEMIFQIVGDANRILGPEHPKTVKYTKYSTLATQARPDSVSGTPESSSHSSSIMKPHTKARLISNIAALNEKEVNAVRYTKDGEKLIADFLEPIPNKPIRFKIPPDQLVFGPMTIVTTPDKKYGMISSFDMDTKEYSVMPLGKMAVQKYKQIDLVIHFDDFDIQKELSALTCSKNGI